MIFKNDPQVRFDEMIAGLREHDFRLTAQRMELVRLVASSEGHPNATQLYDKVKVRFTTMSLATVYKTLARLKEINQVLEIGLRDDSHYDGNRPDPHPHLACNKCNRIVDGDFNLPQEAIQHLELATGYQVHSHQVMFFGVCPDCQEKA